MIAMAETTQPRILMIDDDKLFVDLMMRRFEREALPVEWVASAEEALKLLDQGMQPGLVLLDLHLPGMDGFEFLEKIRAMPQTAKLPVMVLSNFNDPEDLARTKSFGVLGHVQKVSLEPSELVAMVRKTLQT